MIPAPCGHSWVTRFNGSRPSCGMLKRPLTKYQSPPTVNLLNWTWPGKTINQVPRWCAVDLRDGNQSLVNPMTCGFKETEVGFPVASDTNFNFVRKIPKSRQPNLDNVLLPAREDLIWSTFDAVQDGKNMIIHMYHTTSPLLCQKVFQASKAKTIDLAVQHTELVRQLSDDSISRGNHTQWQFEYSQKPSLEPKFSVKICEAVKKAWFHGKDMKKIPPIIFNLPATVEVSTPNSPFHQNPIEYFSRSISDREYCHISLHTHNDCGTGVAATELGSMAGGDCVEGCLFGNGERTVFTAASGSHQDAIKKGFAFKIPIHIGKCLTYLSTHTILAVIMRQLFVSTHNQGNEVLPTSFKNILD
ncbi:hypothetical protein PSHT_03786 [Puccinia striiformis]|uniref:Pyruvate carboxyltransferase domain-containing protein n=1 Tax=Puccinia striiformis TaxID=27350 RepID=A0A2S4WEE1_9BASI|nr:hypothetical protein PSHT_03786 [Puccinia striiformis]